MIIDSSIHNSLNNTTTKSSEEKQDNSFDSQLASSKDDPRYVKEKTQKEIIANMEKLVGDIDSVMRTGMTPEELEQLEKMLELIQKELDEKYPDEQKIKKMLDELEKEIARFKKEITGEAIIEADELDSKPKTEISTSQLNVQERVEKAKKGIEELKEFVEAKQPTQLYSQTELLQEIKQFQSQ